MGKSNAVLNFPQIAERVFNVPLIVEEPKLHAILAVLAPRMGFELGFEVTEVQMEYSAMQARLDVMAQLEAQGLSTKYNEDGGYYVVNGRVGLIPVVGSLVHRSSFMDSMSGMTSYAGVLRKFEAAMNDGKLHTIVMEYDSPGGEVAGAFDAADTIYNARGNGKRIIAVASEKATSGAYLLASAADEVVTPRTGRTGSIGVVASHMDMSRAMERKGIAVTLLYAGEKKVDGHPYGPLDERVMEDWMGEIKDTYGLFTSTVARNRDIGEDRVRGTQAGVYVGGKAIDAGLVDRVNTLSNELANASLRGSRAAKLPDRLQSSAQSTDEEQDMQGTQQQQGGQSTITAADVERAREEGRTEAQQANTQAVEAARAEGMASERNRVKQILTHPEADGRTKMAHHLAFETSMNSDEAGKMLAAAAKETAPSDSPLDRAMRNAGSPGVRGQESSDQSVQRKAPDTNTIYAKRAQQADAYRR